MYLDFLKSGSKRTSSTTSIASASASFSARSEFQLQSTYVSSPAQGHQDDYEYDGFIVPDYEQDSMGMPPVRSGLPRTAPTHRARRQKSQTQQQQVSAPITAEDVMSQLNPLELEMLERFMQQARKIRERIMQRKGLERITSVFMDSVLQKFGIYLPQDMMAMAEIAGSSTRVNDFGNEFLVLCKQFAKEKAENFEGTDVPVRTYSQSQTVAPIEILDDDEDYSEGMDDEDFMEEDEETSEYFKRTSTTTATTATTTRGGAVAVSSAQEEMLSQWQESQAVSAARSNAAVSSKPAAPARARGGGSSTRGRGKSRGGGAAKKYARRTSGGTSGTSGASTKRGGGKRKSGGGRGDTVSFGGGGGSSSRGGGAGSGAGAIRPLW